MERARGLCKEEEKVREANNNECFLGPEYQSDEAAEEIIFLVDNLVFNSDLPAMKNRLN